MTTPTVTLGGSTLPAACGVDPYCSPIRLWLDLTQGRERVETEAMRLGARLQPVILAEMRERGYDCVDGNGEPLFDLARPWLVGHPDGYGGRPPWTTIYEAKASGYPWTALPLQYEAQVQTYLHLFGGDHGFVAQLTGLSLHVWPVERNQHAIDVMLALGEEFVGYVERREQPPPHGHPDDRAALLALHPEATAGRRVRETREIRDARRELAELLAAAKVRKARIEHLRGLITDHMGDAEELISLHDERVATWRNVTTRRLDTDALKQARPEVYEKQTMTRRLVLT